VNQLDHFVLSKDGLALFSHKHEWMNIKIQLQLTICNVYATGFK